MENGQGNAMAEEGRVCANYAKAIKQSSVETKKKFLLKSETVELFTRMPKGVGLILRDSFLSGNSLKDVLDGDSVIDYFQQESAIIPALTENPGTFTMLEKMYHFEDVSFPADCYFSKSIPGGQALRQRYDNVNEKSIEIIKGFLQEQGSCLMIDIGSGPGRNGIEICLKNPEFRQSLKIDNIDIDILALALGRDIAARHKLDNIEFVNESMSTLRKRYPKNVDVGLLIGILCGLQHRERVILLKVLKRYFRPGGKIIAAGLTDNMLSADLFCSYVLYETAGWVLQYQPVGQVKVALQEAGWQYADSFQESYYGLYEIGIGVA